MRGTAAERGSLTERSGAPVLYAAEGLTGIADGVLWVALVVTFADEANYSLLLALAVVARLGPRALLSWPAGALIDRSNVRRLLVDTGVVRAAIILGAAVLVEVGAGPAVTLTMVALAYVVGVPLRPGLTAAVPAIVGERHLATANAHLSTIKQVMTFVGPMVGVGIVAWSTGAGYVVTAAAYLVAALLTGALRGMPRSHVGRRPLPAPKRSEDGHVDVPKVAGLRVLISLVGAMYFVRGAEMVLLVLVVRDFLDADPAAIGYLSGAVGLGAVVAIPLAGRIADPRRLVVVVVVAVVLTAGPLGSLVAVDDLWLASALLVPVGIGMVAFEVASVVTVQRIVDPSRLGRVFGAVNGSANLGRLAGALAVPLVIDPIGLRASVLAVAGIIVVAGLGSLPAMVALSRRSVERSRELGPSVHVLAALDLFDGAPSSALERVAASISAERIAAGTTVIVEGDAADDLFVIRAGTFGVTVDGRSMPDMHRDDWFGEIGLIERSPRAATVTAATDADVWRIPGGLFLDVLEETGAPPSALLQGIADRLATSNPERDGN
ncbi:MAG: MFS transporter [Ilumatobacter sp.]|uniref:MFS transporter n=1 Tax=Ilumatobacter sp. TaxID=1967498 RepID=UPI0026127FCC|nr:MFS transporter [Ilumatobacter sp.]MDJ0770235.1 MFS transporter [Ilumatobacter sp.]